MKIKKYGTSKKKAAIMVAILVVATAVYLLFAWMNHLLPFSAKDKTYQPGEYTTNMNRSDAEKQASKHLSDNPESKTENNQTDTPPNPGTDDTTGKQVASILLTNVGVSGGKVSASGFVTNIAETGGSCEYVFTNGTSEVRKPVETLANPTSTTCKTVSFSADELPTKGSWKAYLRYSSPTSSGQSGLKEFSN